MRSLWSNSINLQHQITPKEYLSKQFSYLYEATKGKLQGSLITVSAHSRFDDQTKGDFDNELFIHSMKINSPSLGYSFTLLRLVHPTLRIYPFAVYSNLTDKKFFGESIDDLERILLEIFNSKEVVDAINSLTSQSETTEELPF